MWLLCLGLTSSEPITGLHESIHSLHESEFSSEDLCSVIRACFRSFVFVNSCRGGERNRNHGRGVVKEDNRIREERVKSAN